MDDFAGLTEAAGWIAPLPERTEELVTRRLAAEALTDHLVARAFAELDPAECAELAELVSSRSAAVSASAKTG